MLPPPMTRNGYTCYFNGGYGNGAMTARWSAPDGAEMCITAVLDRVNNQWVIGGKFYVGRGKVRQIMRSRFGQIAMTYPSKVPA